MEKTGPITFASPQTLGAGRVRITVPGPKATARFLNADINGVEVSRSRLPTGATFEEVWKADNARDAAISRVLREASPAPNLRLLVTTQTGLPASTRKSNKMKIWQEDSGFVLKAQMLGGDPSRMAEVEQEINKVISHFQVELPNQPPPGVGFCVEGGTVLPFDSQGEQVTADLSIPLEPGLHDLVLSVHTQVLNHSRQDGLLERVSHKRDAGDHILRTGERTVASMPGHEFVVWFPDTEQPGHFIFKALFEYGGEASNNSRPEVSLVVFGTSYPTSVSPQHLLTLWDALLQSVRMVS